jgi:hypothetical protein
MAVPTRGETYALIIERLRQLQDGCSMMAHLHNTEGNDTDKLLARGWLGIEEHFKHIQHRITALAQGRLN